MVHEGSEERKRKEHAGNTACYRIRQLFCRGKDHQSAMLEEYGSPCLFATAAERKIRGGKTFSRSSVTAKESSGTNERGKER